jgi:hypothetical protein
VESARRCALGTGLAGFALDCSEYPAGAACPARG